MSDGLARPARGVDPSWRHAAPGVDRSRQRRPPDPTPLVRPPSRPSGRAASLSDLAYGPVEQDGPAVDGHFSMRDMTPEQLAERFPQRKLPAFPEAKLHHGDELPVEDRQWAHILATLPVQDGPCVVGGIPVRVAGVEAKRQALFLWVDRGSVVGWMPIEDLPTGGVRRGEWLISNDGHEVQVARRRPEDLAALRERAPEMGQRDLERRSEAAATLNNDLEHFVATGSSVEHGQAQTYRAERDVLVELAQGLFQAVATAAGTYTGEGFESDGGGIGGLLHRQNAKHTRANATEAQEELAGVPKLDEMEVNRENIAGMSRLADMQLDPNVPVGLRKQFVADVKNRLSAHLHAPEDLHRELGVVASAQPQMYLRRGPIDLLDEQRIENLRCMIGSDL